MGGQRPLEPDMTNRPMLITHAGPSTGVCVCVCVYMHVCATPIPSFYVSRAYEYVTLLINLSCTVVYMSACCTSSIQACTKCLHVCPLCVRAQRQETGAKVKTHLAGCCSLRSFFMFRGWSMLLSTGCSASSNRLPHIKTHWRDWKPLGQSWWNPP